jgi:cell division septation protein DedD
MAGHKHDKPGTENGVPIETGELFENVFREDLEALEDDEQEKAAPKTDATKRKIIEKKPASAVKSNAPEEVRSKRGAKTKEVRMGETGFQPKIGGGSNKIKIALLCALLVAALAFIINSLGIVDFGGLLGLSEPTKKERMKPRVAKKPPTMTDKKTTPVAGKPSQKRSSRQAADKATSRKRRLIVKKPPPTSPSKARSRTVTNRPKPTTTAKKPGITQQRYRPATPTKQPTVVQQPPTPIPAKQRPVVVKKSPQPSTSTQTSVVSKSSPKPMTSTPGPVVAKKPPEPSISKAKPAVGKETLKPAAHTQKKTVPAKGELPPQDRIRSYPYSVYLGSYPTRERADKAISGYGKRGLSPYWVKVDLGEKGVWYRVFAGRYNSRDKAEALVREKGLVDAKVQKTEHAIPSNAFLTKDKSSKKEGSVEEERLPKTTALSYAYAIYLGSYGTIERVEKAVSSYRQKGLSPYWAKVDLGEKGVWYRVFTGHFENKEHAEQFIRKQQLSGASVKKPRYANLLGTFESEEELNARKLALSGLGYSPYVINGVHGESRLYTGAFYQRRRAEKQRAELASKGIACEVVER